MTREHFEDEEYNRPDEALTELLDALDDNRFEWTDVEFDAAGKKWLNGQFSVSFEGLRHEPTDD